MRIWDFSVSKLCRAHLLGEHRELHAIWTVITKDKKGYSHHPETVRWKGKLKALYLRHQEEAEEMEKRGYDHKSSLSLDEATGKKIQDKKIDSIGAQRLLIKKKGCGCKV